MAPVVVELGIELVPVAIGLAIKGGTTLYNMFKPKPPKKKTTKDFKVKK